MRRSILISILLFVVIVPLALAQSGLPPWATVDANGQITFNPNGLQPTGAIMLPPPPGYPVVQVDLGNGQQFCVGCLTFNTYQASDGSAVVIPTNYAAMVMADAQYNPFNQPVEGYLGNTLIAMFAEGGNFDPMVYSPQAIQDAQAIHDMLASGQLDPLFLARMNAAMNDPNSPLFQGSLFLGAGIFSFRCNPVTGTCRDQPLGTPQPGSTPGANPTPPGPPVTPVPEECPINLRVSQQLPTIGVQKIAPAYPIVVGQDPGKRGVDVSASIQTHPAIVKFDVPKYEHECQYVGGDILDSACQNNPGWKNKKIFVGCETKTLTYPDPIAFAVIEADLAPESIRWITTDLAAKYPGAHVYQAHWALWPGRAPSQGGLSGDQTNLSVTYLQLPLADPGAYTLRIQGRTTGTPFTPPRSLSFTAPAFDVQLLESTLIR